MSTSIVRSPRYCAPTLQKFHRRSAMTSQKAPQMIYRHLGRTGLKVSRCSLSQMTMQMIHALDHVMVASSKHLEMLVSRRCDESFLYPCPLVAASSSGSLSRVSCLFSGSSIILAGICSQLWRMGDIWKSDWSPRCHTPCLQHIPTLHCLRCRY